MKDIKLSVKMESCKKCGRKVSYWELKRYNGLCVKCFIEYIYYKEIKVG